MLSQGRGQDYTLEATEAERRRSENRAEWRLGSDVSLPNQLADLGERRELPQWGPGRCPGRQGIFGIIEANRSSGRENNVTLLNKAGPTYPTKPFYR